MKKTKSLLILIIAGTLTFSAGLWLYSTKEPLQMKEILIAALVIALVIISIIVGLKRLKKEKQGIATEDELSNAIKIKAAARSFVFSIYLWLFIMIFTMDKDISSEVLIGIGMIGMAIIFFINWAWFSSKGVDDENPY